MTPNCQPYYTPCLLFEQLFLERLPENIRIQLVDLKFNDYHQMAKQADAVALLLPADCVITTAHSVRQLGSAGNLANGRETSRPAASSGLGSRP